VAKAFLKELKQYYCKVGRVLRGEADVASIFPNAGDIGTSREGIYAEILKAHIPSSCNVGFGGVLFNKDGDTSKQLDILITGDSCIRFDLLAKYGRKTFACIEGCIGVVAVKSTLNKRSLFSALENIASIPEKEPLGKRKISLKLEISGYEEWPYKVVYASNGIKPETLLKHTYDFYEHSEIPPHKRPNIIHVAGRYVIQRIGKKGGETPQGQKCDPNMFSYSTTAPDVQGLILAIGKIQQIALASRHILVTYTELFDRMRCA